MRSLLLIVVILFFIAPQNIFAQKVTYSDYGRQDNNSNLNFEIIGKMNSNILVYKNINKEHNITLMGAADMQIIGNEPLDFIPQKTFNIDFITYPDHFYMIYQYQKKNVLYCMGVNMDANGKKNW